MRNRTQERIEELARERAATTIDLGLVEEGIETGKKMMAEMIATYHKGTGRPNLNEVRRSRARASLVGRIQQVGTGTHKRRARRMSRVRGETCAE